MRMRRGGPLWVLLFVLGRSCVAVAGIEQEAAGADSGEKRVISLSTQRNSNDDKEEEEVEKEDKLKEAEISAIHPQEVVDWLQKVHNKVFFMSENIGFNDGQSNKSDVMHQDGAAEKRNSKPFLMAKKHIPAGETLLIIPNSAILKPPEIPEQWLHACHTTLKLLDEHVKGPKQQSRFHPYVEYLWALPHPPSPFFASSVWSDQAKRLVRNITGAELEPQDFGRAEDSNSLAQCQDEEDYGAVRAQPDFQQQLQKGLSIVQHFSWDKYLVPLYDVVRKDDPDKANVQHFAVLQTNDASPKNDDSNYVLKARRDIVPGEPLVLAHQSATDRFLKQGSVGPLPQTWFLQTLYDNHADIDLGYEYFLIFHLHEAPTKTDDETTTTTTSQQVSYKVTWFDNPSSPPQTGQLRCMVAHLRRLRDMQAEIMRAVQQLTSATERTAIMEFYQAWTTALRQAIIWAKHHHEEEEPPEESLVAAVPVTAVNDDSDAVMEEMRSLSSNGGEEPNGDGPALLQNQDEHCVSETATTTKTAASRYDSLLEDKADPLDMLYNDAYAGIGCMVPIFDNHVYETRRTAVQEMEWAVYSKRRHPNNKSNNTTRYNDTCLLLDGFVHSCISMRPHVHETIVHYPASFLPKGGVKRVLFVGGGDLIILHEIMKYNQSLELVIGMELDQDVARASFRNYGVQPQLDDERVVWWFGDAAKSLAILPEEYLGTFDLVMIDLLSFILDSLKVGDEHLVDYMMKLLKPEGILIRQEDYMQRYTTDFARFVVGLDLVGVPYFCQQHFTMGSNRIDFSKASRVDHELDDNIWYKPSMEGYSHTAQWGYFNTNELPPPRMCASQNPGEDESSDGASAHVANNGILVILEAENVTAPLAESSAVLTNIRKALQAAGFTNVALTDAKREDNNASVVLFNEGHVVFRAWPEYDYCALDLQLWNNIDKREEAIAQLLSAVGGKAHTSFQITTSGKAATHSETGRRRTKFADEMKSRCETEATVVKSALEPNDFAVVLQKLVGCLTVKVSNPLLFVVCENPSSECQSLQALTNDKEPGTYSVVLVHSCSGADEHDGLNMRDCEVQLQKSLRHEVLLAGKKFDGFVMDPNTPLAMGQVVHKVFNSSLLCNELLADDFVILMPHPEGGDESSSIWREHFLERFRFEIVQFNPVYHAYVRFDKKTLNSLQVGIFLSGDAGFYSHMIGAMVAIEETTGLNPTLLRSEPGLLAHQPGYEILKYASIDEYNLGPSREQRDGQRPLAYQVVSQFEAMKVLRIPQGANVMYNMDSHRSLGYWAAAKVELLYEDSGHYDILVSHDNKRRKFVRHSSLLHVTDFMAKEPLEFGEHVLIKSDINGLWYQGHVVEVKGAEVYKVQRFFDGKLTVETRSNLVRTRDKPVPVHALDLSCAEFQRAWREVVDRINSKHTVTVDSSGDGCVMVGVFSGGNIVSSWDGRGLVDVNLFTLQPPKTTQRLIERYLPREIHSLVRTQNDTFPRGVGRVVNFPEDLVGAAAWFDSENPRAFRRRR